MKIEYGDFSTIIELIVKEATKFNNPIASIYDLYDYLEDNSNELLVINKGGKRHNKNQSYNSNGTSDILSYR